MGIVRDSRQFLAHRGCAVIFAIARLSCLMCRDDFCLQQCHMGNYLRRVVVTSYDSWLVLVVVDSYAHHSHSLVLVGPNYRYRYVVDAVFSHTAKLLRSFKILCCLLWCIIYTL